MMAKKKQAKMFTYGVGFYWNGKDGSVGLYSYHGETFYGTMEEARTFQSYCQNQPDNKGKNKREYKIFQLVEVPE